MKKLFTYISLIAVVSGSGADLPQGKPDGRPFGGKGTDNKVSWAKTTQVKDKILRAIISEKKLRDFNLRFDTWKMAWELKHGFKKETEPIFTPPLDDERIYKGGISKLPDQLILRGYAEMALNNIHDGPFVRLRVPRHKIPPDDQHFLRPEVFPYKSNGNPLIEPPRQPAKPPMATRFLDTVDEHPPVSIKRLKFMVDSTALSIKHHDIMIQKIEDYIIDSDARGESLKLIVQRKAEFDATMLKSYKASRERAVKKHLILSKRYNEVKNLPRTDANTGRVRMIYIGKKPK